MGILVEVLYRTRDWLPYISRALGVPEGEQAVEGPFDALDALLLVLLGVLGGEGQVGDTRPVLAPVEIQQS